MRSVVAACMQSLRSASRAALGAAFLLIVASCASPRPVAQDPRPMDRLGRPIGSFVCLEGVREEHGKVGSRTLRVERVDGVALAQPIDVDLEDVELPAGERCAVSGYETGRWIGIPPDVARVEHLMLNQAGWQFAFTFVVTSVQAPASLAERVRTR